MKEALLLTVVFISLGILTYIAYFWELKHSETYCTVLYVTLAVVTACLLVSIV